VCRMRGSGWAEDGRIRLLVGESEAEATGWRMRWSGCLVEVEEVRLGGG
jgi:hypothetical protein